MRFVIVLPCDVAVRLQHLAERDHRLLRQQAEFLLCKAIEQAAKAQDCAKNAEAQEQEYASAP